MLTLPDRARAWVWTGNSEPWGIHLASVPTADLGPNDVWVRNAAVGLNPVDWKVLKRPPDSWAVGNVPGVDGAGVVAAVGAAVDDAWIGQRVTYHQSLSRSGSFADYTSVAARALLRVPDALDFATAASLPCPALTAWLAIEKLPVKPGKRLLVTGAGGAVGNYLVQLAAARGFEVSALSHERHHDRLRGLGAAQTLRPLASAALPQRTSDECFFAIVDLVSGAHAQRIAKWVSPNGHLVCVQDRLETPAWPAFGPAVSLHEVALGAMHAHGDAGMWADMVHAGEAMLSATVRGQLRPEPAIVGEFSRLPDHLTALCRRSVTGKFVVLL